MTAPTRQPNASRPYSIAATSSTEPKQPYDPNGWVPVIIAGVVAAFVIAIFGVFAALAVVNIRESAPRAPKPAAAQVPVAATVPRAEIPVENLDPFAVQGGVARILGEEY